MRVLLLPAAVVAASVGFASPGNAVPAMSSRTWVSGVGDDANTCTRTAPCLTFAGAIGKTAAGGEINVLDPGDFGPVTITKAITIRADYVEAGVQVGTGTVAITVNAGSSDTVVLEGLDLDGENGAGAVGVSVGSGSLVYIVRCAVRGFGTGVVAGSSTSGARVFVQDSFISRNVTGVSVGAVLATKGPSPSGASAVALSNTLVDGNSGSALFVTSGSSVALAGSILSGSPAGINNNGGTVNSIGPSNVITGTGAPTLSTPYR